MSRIEDNLTIVGNLRVAGTSAFAGASGIARSDLTQESLTLFLLSPETWRIHDNMDALLGDPPVGGAGNDDLGIVSGTYGTGVPSIQTGDNKAAGSVTKYARQTVQLPANYVAGQTVSVRLHAGMIMTVASSTATVDVEAYKSDNEAAVDGADLCATSAASCNSLTFADLDFTITPTALNPGDVLDIRIAIATNDAATATAVIGCIGLAALLCDTKG